MKIICRKFSNQWVATIDDTTTEDIEFPSGLKAGEVWHILRHKFPESQIGFDASDIGPRTEALCPDGVLWMR